MSGDLQGRIGRGEKSFLHRDLMHVHGIHVSVEKDSPIARHITNAGLTVPDFGPLKTIWMLLTSDWLASGLSGELFASCIRVTRLLATSCLTISVVSRSWPKSYRF